MSDAAITKDSLHHYDNRHLQVRWDFFDLCAYDKADFNQGITRNGKKVKDEPNQECMAKILRILETLTDAEKLRWYMDAKRLEEQGLKIPAQPKEFPIQLSYGAIVSLLYGTYGESTVRNSVAFLIQRGFIKQYQQTKNSIPFYVLMVDAVQKALKEQAEKSLSGVEIDSQSSGTFQVLKSTARRPKSTARRPKSTGGSSEIDSQTSEIDTNNNSKNDNNGENGKNESDPPSPTHPSLPSSSVSYEHNTSLIANAPTGNDPMPDIPSKQRNTEPLLTAEEKRVFDLLCEVFYAIPPEVITPKIKKQCADLAPHVRSTEDLKSLRDYARAQIANNPELKDRQVYLGNLVKGVNGWKQEQTPLPEKPNPPTSNHKRVRTNEDLIDTPM